MATFDFDGSARGQRSVVRDTLSLSKQLTDSTPNPVTFTVSFAAKLPGRLVWGGIEDPGGPGFEIDARVTAQPTTFSEVSTPVNTLNITFGIATPTASRAGFTTASNPLLIVNGATVTGTVINGGAQVSFTISNPTATRFAISELMTNFTCFCAGTRIATPDGFTLVEDLRPGDALRLSDGRTTKVRWLGRQRVDMKLAHPAEANPIRITKGALGNSLPKRDLRVSKDHAIAIDGILINAGALVNGTTIYQETNSQDAFTYYHIETDAHELILAEGIAAETFMDHKTRDTFENAHEAPDRMIPEMPLPRISAARLVPEHIRDRLRPLTAAE